MNFCTLSISVQKSLLYIVILSCTAQNTKPLPGHILYRSAAATVCFQLTG